jgi:ABC-type uncharacterized transport system substrate-binding protein
VRQGNELAGAFARISRERCDALLGLNNGFHLTYRKVIVGFAAENRLPAMYSLSDMTQDGGLMSYGAVRAESFRHAAIYVAKILKGAKPADLPIEQPTKYELVINLKTAKALSLVGHSAANDVRGLQCLLDHLVGAQRKCRRDAQPKRPRGLEVDYQFELGRCLNRKLGRFLAA